MQISDVQERPFGRVRNFLWPIHTHELKKIISMFSLFFLISFIYNTLHNLKSPLLLKSPGSCSEVLPYVKFGVVLPGAVLFTYLFTFLISRFEREQVFYTILIAFLTYFALFLFVFYPYSEEMQLDTIADFLHTYVFTGEGSKGLIAAVRNINFTLFYLLSEMWSAVVLSMLFWGFANEITKVEEAKRFYAVFALGANISGIFFWFYSKALEQIPYMSFLPFDQDDQWIFLQLSTVLVLGTLVMTLFYRLNRTVFHLENVESLQIPKKSRKISMGECFTYLRRSKYLTYMVIIVVAYNLVYNLTDVMWQDKLNNVCTSKQEFNSYMNYVTLITGVIAVFLTFIVSGNVIRRFGWTVTALLTPVIWFLASIGFFSGLMLEHLSMLDVLSGFFSNPAYIILIMGSIQICLGRGFKYTVFDEAKEIAFIPLPKENQRKGKAVVDGLASRFGKSGGSLIYIMLLSMFGSVVNTIPYVTVIIFVALVAWIFAVFRMGKIVEKAISGDESFTLVEEGILSDQRRARDAVEAQREAALQPN